MSWAARRVNFQRKLAQGRPKRIPQLIEAAKKTKWNILRGDTVQVVGKHAEKGKQGVIIEVDRKSDQVVVEGVNMKERFVKADPESGTKRGSEMMPHPLNYSQVNLVDPVTGFPTRVGRKYLEDGTRVRVSKRSGAIIPRPEILLIRRKPISQTVSDKCTTDELVWKVTYDPKQDRLDREKYDYKGL
eukprot:CAMPEP_0194357470 /NCGR_PEP_ID=MMETSP0174-20130528/4941_1 /TAXON_ID=216777 /ORGANISM="Proboscia alata, Strain PI-D3" /LENGTH=186 /DNA_ID=CAMNT_0039127499 /DNA_START=29 /DNA_END=589 /DNA_ORIENTATION=+